MNDIERLNGAIICLDSLSKRFEEDIKKVMEQNNHESEIYVNISKTYFRQLIENLKQVYKNIKIKELEKMLDK